MDVALDPGADSDVALPGSPGDYAVQIEARAPVVAGLESQGRDGDSGVPALLPDLGWTWVFADGAADGATPSELRVLNPNDNPAHVELGLPDGAGGQSSRDVVAPPYSLALVPFEGDTGGGRGAAELRSDVPIAVERVDRSPGTDAPTAIVAGTSPDAIHFQGRNVLGDRFLLLNMPASLFRERRSEIQEDIYYARWMNASAIRVFTTDPITYKPWSGRDVGARIVEIAPDLRQSQMKLIVSLVSNYQPVPGETSHNFGITDGFYQLQPAFYSADWRGAYLGFARDLIATVRDGGALDVIAAWEVGNELHTPSDPPQILDFLRQASAEIRALDPDTPTLSGTMGANHLDPWKPSSAVARALYCELPFDMYTLHTYDWIDRTNGGDMPIDWDLDNIVSRPCPSGRRLDVLVEELGTTKALPGRYDAADEQGRVAQELHQLRFVLGYPIVRGVGAWSAESPVIQDNTYFDDGRGLTSYGPERRGSGSCYPSGSGSTPRCLVEIALRNLPTPP
jgi:hypothetical protein